MLKEIIQKFKEFWADNLGKNYKKISIYIGIFLNTLVGFLCFKFLDVYFPYAGEIWSALFILLQVIIFGFFGTRKNGNGYKMPSEGEIKTTFEKFPRLKEFFLKKEADTKHVKRILEDNPDLRLKFNEFLRELEIEQKKLKF